MNKKIKALLSIGAIGGCLAIATPFVVSCSQTSTKTFLQIANENRQKQHEQFSNEFTQEFINNLKNGTPGMQSDVKEYETEHPERIDDKTYTIENYKGNLSIVHHTSDYPTVYLIGSEIKDYLYNETKYNIYITCIISTGSSERPPFYKTYRIFYQ